MAGKFQSGQWVVYRLTKRSTNPGPRAKSIEPSPAGESYAYQVDKYWCVDEVLPDEQLRLRTRRGKIRSVEASDPLLRHASWWEKLLLKNRFPDPNAASNSDAHSDPSENETTVESTTELNSSSSSN